MTRVITSGSAECILDGVGPGLPAQLVQAETCDNYGLTLNVQAWAKGTLRHNEARVVVALDFGDESRCNFAEVDLYAGGSSIWVPAKKCLARVFLEPLVRGVPTRNPQTAIVTAIACSGATGGWYRNRRTITIFEPAPAATEKVRIPPFAKAFNPVFNLLAPNAVTGTIVSEDGLTVLGIERLDTLAGSGATRNLPAGAAFINVTSAGPGVRSNLSLVFDLGL